MLSPVIHVWMGISTYFWSLFKSHLLNETFIYFPLLKLQHFSSLGLLIFLPCFVFLSSTYCWFENCPHHGGHRETEERGKPPWIVDGRLNKKGNLYSSLVLGATDRQISAPTHWNLKSLHRSLNKVQSGTQSRWSQQHLVLSKLYVSLKMVPTGRRMHIQGHGKG